MNVLVFLYKHVLKHPLDKTINAERAPRRVKIPVVLTREETAQIITLMSGIHQLAAKLLYGSGQRTHFQTQLCHPSAPTGDRYPNNSGALGA